MLIHISCTGKDGYRKCEGIVWNTTYHIAYRCNQDLSDSIMAVLDEVGKSLSAFDPASGISRINDNSDLTADRHIATIISESQRISRITGGAFDPTVAPLVKAWGFGQGHKATADTLRIDSILRFTGISKVRISEGRVIKEDPRTTFNFSAIAKGYGCDEIGRMLQRNRATDFLVEIGGEIRASGKSSSGSRWRISIDRPVFSSTEEIHDSQMIIATSDCGIATSGNYRNYSGEGNNRKVHTISPRTGMPVQTDILSATIVAKTAMEADALATACMVLGSRKALRLTDSLGIPAMFILPGNECIINNKFKPLIYKQ